MAAFEDIKQLACPAGSFTWVVHGQPVVAVFPSAADDANAHSRDQIGQPSPHNAVPHDLLLWIGLDQAANRLLLTLTQRIRVSSTRNSRLMFLIVPVENLTLQVHKPSFWTLDQEKLPLAMFDVPSDVKSAQASRLLKMSFSLGTNDKSRVIMPDLRYGGDVSRHSLLLLRKLKALSEASDFDLFTSHNSWTQQGLGKARHMLQTESPVTPKFDLKNLYPGPRDGSWDNWQDQGWHDRDECELDKTESTVLRAKKRDRGRGTAQQVYKRRHKQQSPGPSTRPPPYQDSRSPSVCLSNPVHDGTLVTSVNHQGDTLPTYQTTVGLTGEVPTVPRSDSGSTTVLDPLEIPGLEEGRNDLLETTALEQGRNHLPTITSSCFQSEPTSPLSPTDNQCFPGRALSSVVPETPVANLVASSHSVDDENLPLSLEVEFSLLMPHIWNLCPDAHFVFIVELLKLGSAAKTKPNQFRKIRVMFMNTFLSYVATNPSSVPTSKLAVLSNLDTEIPSLLAWLSALDSTADLSVMSSLLRMAELRQQLLHLGTVASGGDMEEYLAVVRMFQQTKSVVVTTVCMSFGEKVLERDKNIAANMLQAKRLICS